MLDFVYLDGRPSREVVRKQSPGTSAADDVEDGVKDLSRRVRTLGLPGAFGVGIWGSI